MRRLDRNALVCTFEGQQGRKNENNFCTNLGVKNKRQISHNVYKGCSGETQSLLARPVHVRSRIELPYSEGSGLYGSNTQSRVFLLTTFEPASAYGCAYADDIFAFSVHLDKTKWCTKERRTVSNGIEQSRSPQKEINRNSEGNI